MVTSEMSAVGETPEKTRPAKNVEKKVLKTADVTITIKYLIIKCFLLMLMLQSLNPNNA